MEEGFSYKLNDLFEELLTGKYHEVIEKADAILNNEETPVEEGIEAMLAKSWSLYFLAEFEFRVEYTEEAIETTSEAFEESSEIGNTLLMFAALYMKSWAYSRNFDHKKAVESIELAKEIYGKLNDDFPDLSKESKAFMLSLEDLNLYNKEFVIKNYKWDSKEAISYLKEALKLNAETSDSGTKLNKILTMLLYYQFMIYYGRMNNYDKSIEYCQKALSLSEEHKNDYCTGYLLQIIGRYHWFKGEHDLNYDYTTQARIVLEKIGNVRGVSFCYHNLGVYYWHIGDYKKALENSQKAYDIYSKEGKTAKDKKIAQVLSNIAAMYQTTGDFDESFSFFDKAIDASKQVGWEELVYLNYSNKSVLFIATGQYDKALEILNRTLEYNQRRGIRRALSRNLFNIGAVYQAKGLFNKAHDNFKKCLEYFEEIGNKTVIVETLYYLVLFALEFDKNELAKEYNEELVKKTEDVDYKISKNQVLIAEAAILAKSTDDRDRIRAELIYDQQLNEKHMYPVHLGLIFHLCELLLSELKISSDEGILAKLQKYVNKLIELSTKNHVTALIVESLWFKAQLSLLNLDFEKAKELLTQAQTIAEDKGLNRLTLKTMKTKEQLVHQIIELEELKEDPTISNIMEVIEIENGFKEISNSQMFQFKQNI